MQICKLLDGQPTLIRLIPAAYANISNPQLSDLLSAGWRQYCPLADRPRYIRTTAWIDDGRRATETITSTLTPEELAAQDAAAAQAEADRQAAEAAAQAQWQAMQRDIDLSDILLLRALALVLLEEHNRSAAWVRSFVAAVAASTSLANLQSRVAALAAMPDRTAAQLRLAVINKALELQ